VTSYCCQLRRKFVVAIVADDESVFFPTDQVDAIVAWEPRIVVRIAFCPFCGTKIAPDAPTRVALPEAKP